MSRPRKLPQEQLLLQKDTKNNICRLCRHKKESFRGTGKKAGPVFLSSRAVFLQPSLPREGFLTVRAMFIPQDD